MLTRECIKESMHGAEIAGAYFNFKEILTHKITRMVILDHFTW